MNLAKRMAKLLDMDKVALRKLCEQSGSMGAFVREVMVEHLLREAMFMVELKRALPK